MERLYTRGITPASWQATVYSLQHILQTNFIIGGLFALELKWYSHYLPNSNKTTIDLYGNDKLPVWVNEIVNDVVFIKHSRSSLFGEMDETLSLKYTTSIIWRDDSKQLRISTPERACLEMLDFVPNNISFEHADQLIQGMTSLSPRALLEMCSSIKVKRLFLWFAKRHNYIWFTKLDLKKIELGSGNRVIEKGGKLDKNFLITVPKNFDN